MKFTKRNDITVDGVRQGFTLKDSIALRKDTNNNPDVQIFSYEDDLEDPEDRTYWCAICKSKLEYLMGSDTIWRCDSCMEYYDTKIQDSVIKNKEDFKLAPYYGLRHYPTADADDIPFVEAINLDDTEEEEEDLESRTFEDKRVQKIHVKGSLADAILKGALTSKTSRKDDDS